MFGDYNTIIYIISILVLVVSTAYWTFNLFRSGRSLHQTLALFYAFYCIESSLSAMLLLNICTANKFVESTIMGIFTQGLLYMLPSLVVVLKTVTDGHMPSRQFLAYWLLPITLYASFVAFLHAAYGAERIMSTFWMREVETVLYNYLLFISTVLSVAYILWHSRQYVFHSCNYYSDKDITDCSCVEKIRSTGVLTGAIIYVFILLTFRSFMNNWFVTVPLILFVCYCINILGYTLQKVKGVAVPADFDWSYESLNSEEVEALEKRNKHTDQLIATENASKNISEIINSWVHSPHPSYLKAGITLAEAAYEMKIPANILSGYINKTLDTNFNQWVNRYRLKHVKYLLLTSDSNLDEIAVASGFATRNLLSRTFKAHEGVTPTEFRASKRKQ